MFPSHRNRICELLRIALSLFLIFACARIAAAQPQDYEVSAGPGEFTVNDEPTLTLGASGSPVVNIGSQSIKETS